MGWFGRIFGGWDAYDPIGQEEWIGIIERLRSSFTSYIRSMEFRKLDQAVGGIFMTEATWEEDGAYPKDQASEIKCHYLCRLNRDGEPLVGDRLRQAVGVFDRDGDWLLIEWYETKLSEENYPYCHRSIEQFSARSVALAELLEATGGDPAVVFQRLFHLHSTTTDKKVAEVRKWRVEDRAMAKQARELAKKRGVKFNDYYLCKGYISQYTI